MKLNSLALLAALASFAGSTAHATVVTFDLGFGGSGQTIADPYSSTQSGQTLKVWAETIDNNPGGGGIGQAGKVTGQLSLFSVTNGQGGNNASGMAPFTGGAYTSQAGITESNVLMIDLSGITAGSTVTFTLVQSPGQNDSYNVWSGTSTSTPTGFGTAGNNLGQGGTSPLTTELYSNRFVTGNATFTISNIPAHQWIGIQADCNYLLLGQIQVTTPGVPEPKFYGILGIGLLTLIIANYKRRARAGEQV
ncbi:MAG: hypothetical protein C5B51_12940 [Terriglobia bacterium]|nr:MAG: hypothetical protein C5B51_12940 [Terriglobia bacterium]